MSYFKKVFEKIKNNAENDINCIPSDFKRFKEYFLGIIRSTYIIICANSGVGKSRFTKWAYMFVPFRYMQQNPQLNIKLKIFYFSLEENKDKFIRSVISSELYRRYKLEISPRDLLSMNSEDKKIDDEVLTKIMECEEYIEELLKTVEVIDYTRNAFGIFKTVREYARQNGKFYFKGVEIDYESNPNAIYDSYIPNNPDEYVIVITDPINLLHPDKGQNSLFEAMQKFSSDYCLTMRDKFGYTVVNVQQLASDTEKQEYTFKGQSIEAKLEPSLSALGDCKLTARDADEVYGLFAPDRYEIKEHRGYDIIQMQDSYRNLSKLKDRDGEANARIGLYFQGAVNEFSELPKSEDLKYGLNGVSYSDYK